MEIKLLICNGCDGPHDLQDIEDEYFLSMSIGIDEEPNKKIGVDVFVPDNGLEVVRGLDMDQLSDEDLETNY